MESKPKRNYGRLISLIFWGYNFVFVSFLALFLLNIFTSQFGTIPSIWEVLTFGGRFPTYILIVAYTILLTPFISSTIALFTKLKKQPFNLIRLFFGFEIPLLVTKKRIGVII